MADWGIKNRRFCFERLFPSFNALSAITKTGTNDGLYETKPAKTDAFSVRPNEGTSPLNGAQCREIN